VGLVTCRTVISVLAGQLRHLSSVLGAQLIDLLHVLVLALGMKLIQTVDSRDVLLMLFESVLVFPLNRSLKLRNLTS